MEENSKLSQFQPVKSIFEINREERMAPGHRACAGCGPMIAVRQILQSLDVKPVVISATGCVEVTTSTYPDSAWLVPWAHVAFENSAAVASGVEAAMHALKVRGELKEERPVIALAGDGGTFDIGLQALSGALERGHRMLYVCYDNEAYMNTGIQRSSATPFGAWTTTSPVGKEWPGKAEIKKDIMGIVVAHGTPYAATASISHWKDLMTKVRKAVSQNGPTFLHVYAPCNRGWRFEPKDTVEVAKRAVETRFFPLYEVENGRYRITVPVAKPRPLEDFLSLQGRFSHLLKPENLEVLKELKSIVEERWSKINAAASVQVQT
ncbi:MAG: pyruvate ferredoxin oxidoreductase [Nitrososphaerota archaeon]|jgi:pyruvate ferredoxin oxidoreductase beta subunit|nr:pyruvate ferredoxin oxidoreductase [Nitrososphaerota archaeon]MDG7046589.1 pyruvate ferredoxin oxidoreductase [Nitrososphaerota archaeon]